MSDFQTVKESIRLKDYANAKLERVRGGLVCPACGSGKGPSHSPAFSITGENWKCFSCQRGGDVFDLAAIIEGLDEKDRRGQLQAVAAWGGIPLIEPNEIPLEKNQYQGRPIRAQKTEKPKPDYSAGQQIEREYIAKSRTRITDPEALSYLKARGFTDQDIAAYGFGYDPQHKTPWTRHDGTRHRGGRIVIPWLGCDHYHIDRAMDDQAKERKYYKPKTDQVGPQPLYNPDAIQAPAFFLVEGPLDALAVKACGYEAAALMGTNNRENLDAIIKAKPAGAVIVALDNDESGRTAQRAILSTLEEKRVIATSASWEPYKDAGEWLTVDREGLKSFLRAVYDQAIQTYQQEKESRLETILDSFRVRNPVDVATDIYLGGYYEDPLPTGLRQLDRVLCGGMKSGLHTLGAVSSLGKTTLALQIADNIAAGGRPVLFVTIEQSAGELTAKSLNRYLYQMSGEMVPTWQILGDNAQWTLDQRVAFENACQLYGQEIGPNMRIMEGTRQPSVDDIRLAAEYMADYQGQAPVVFVDYLQLLAAHSDRDSDKQAVDKNVMALRQLARDLRTPVFVISSLNRSSYSEGVTLESFKESGAVEYGADVLLGLQAKGIETTVEAAGDKAVKRASHKFMRSHKSTETRECELVILKNRNGITPKDNLPLQFKAGASLFLEG